MILQKIGIDIKLVKSFGIFIILGVIGGTFLAVNLRTSDFILFFSILAFIVGLLTAENTRQSLFEIINNWSKNDRIALIDSANDISFENIGPEGKSIGEWLEILSGLALQGLDERSSFLNIKNERKLLESTLSEFLNDGPNTLSIQKRFDGSGLSLNSFLLDLT